MIKTPLIQRLVLGLIFVSVLLTNIFAGCDNGPYKTFSQTKGTGHFSFEYPREYKLNSYDKYQGLVAFKLNREYKEFDSVSSYFVLVSTPSSLYFDTESALAYQLQVAQYSEAYRFVDDIEALVDGVQAKGVVYEDKSFAPIGEHPNSAKPIIVRVIVFEYNSVIWTIKLTSYNLLTTEGDSADFEYLLQSFKFLD